ncbi:MAG: preprotein translocase subunit YajC [Planctomycetota bacterium]
MTELLQSLTVLAQEGGDGGQDASGLVMIVPMLLILGVFFWMSHRSQKKKKQEREELIDSIQQGEDVVTIGGIRGRVAKVGEDTFQLCVDEQNNVHMEVSKGAVSGRPGEQEDEE